MMKLTRRPSPSLFPLDSVDYPDMLRRAAAFHEEISGIGYNRLAGLVRTHIGTRPVDDGNNMVNLYQPERLTSERDPSVALVRRLSHRHSDDSERPAVHAVSSLRSSPAPLMLSTVAPTPQSRPRHAVVNPLMPSLSGS